MKVGYDTLTVPLGKLDKGLKREIVKILSDRFNVSNIEIISDSVNIGVLFVFDGWLKKLSKTVLLAKNLSEGVKIGVRDSSEGISEV